MIWDFNCCLWTHNWHADTNLELPGGVNVSDINPNHFTIEWSPSASNCLPVIYNILTTDCGECPNTTSDTFITCTNLIINGQVCSVTIVIQTNVNDENNSEHSGATNLTIALQGKICEIITGMSLLYAVTIIITVKYSSKCSRGDS